jgi:peptide chain release factor 2
MLLDDIKELLKEIYSHLTVISEFVANSKLSQQVEYLIQQTESEQSWQKKETILQLKELQAKRSLLIEYEEIKKNFSSLTDLATFLSDEPEAATESDLKQVLIDCHGMLKTIKKFKLYILLQKEHDDANCFIEINSGAGGTESQDWAEILMRMYLRFAEREGFKSSILDLQNGEEAGIKSASLYLQKKYAYGLLFPESGVHRLVRISPYDANKRRHTSFASITVYPEITDASTSINPEELRIDTYRAGGAGGQHVNKTESAVRITHIPSGIIVQCQNERSQMQNKATAMKMLASRLAEKQEEERKATQDKSVERKKIEWGSQIRSYVLHPYKMVKDHRTGFENFNTTEVLDGDIMNFIESFLTKSPGDQETFDLPQE